MPIPSAHRSSRLPRLRADASGATAVEFALVAGPFFALLGAIIQVGLVIWAQQNLDFVFQRAIRGVLTGAFQQSNAQGQPAATLLSALRDTMCGTGTGLTPVVFKCSSVKIDLTSTTSFAKGAPTYPIDAATRDWSAGFGTNYACAAPGTIVVATAAVKLPVLFWLLDGDLANFADGSKLLMATSVFRTEPYATAGNSPC